MPIGISSGFGIGVVQNRIYVIGGQDTGVNEVYYPETDTWATKSLMPTPRNVVCTQVINGKIYVIGGEKNATSILDANEAYDPETDTWATKSSLPTPRIATCTHVVNGKIYVIGGRAANGSVFGTNEVYDTATDTWTTETSMPVPDAGYLSAVVDNKIYVFAQNSTCIYDTEINMWSDGTPIPTYQYGETVATTGVLAPKRIYVIGGYLNPYSTSDIFSHETNMTQVYNPITDAWSTSSAMPTARAGLCVAVLDDVFYAIGGSSVAMGLLGPPYGVNEQYTPVGYGTPDPSYLPSQTPMASPSFSSAPLVTPAISLSPSPSASVKPTQSPQPQSTDFPAELVYAAAGAAAVVIVVAVFLKKGISHRVVPSTFASFI
jgi:N-acetylneuraminic acid mutarotase